MENYKFYTIVDAGGEGVQLHKYDLYLQHIRNIDFMKFYSKDDAVFNLEVINTRLESDDYDLDECVELPLRVVKLSVSVDFEEIN